MDSVVIIRVDNNQKTTGIRKNTNCPYYNEYFVFEFYTTLELLLDKNVKILVRKTVIEPCNIWRRRRLLGEIMLDVATIWQQQSHQFYHKWAILTTSKTEAYTGPRGYLKLDICVLAKGEIPKTPTNVINDDIEGNLLLPEGKFTERHKAKYIFDIFKCINLIDKPSLTIREKELNIEVAQRSGPSIYVEITFAGVSVKTSIKKHTLFPEFNERLIIVDMFPPLCQTIKIEACHGDSLRKLVHSQILINLKQISNDKDEGFLPTLGPIYLHLYSNNILEGFAGSILMSINTELDDSLTADAKKGTKIETIAAINEKKYFQEENITLFACISELTAINKKYSKKPVCIVMTFGDVLVQKRVLPTGIELSTNTTDEVKPKKIAKNLYYTDFYKERPCLWINKDVPYFKKRVYNSNMLSRIARELKDMLGEIEILYENDNPMKVHNTIDQKLLNVKDFLEVKAKNYLDIVTSYKVNFNTKLDIERRKMCIQEMIDILEKVKKDDTKLSNKKKFRNFQKIWNRINSLIDDIPDCWPFVILWLVHGKKKVALFRISVKDIIFSPIIEEKGQYCGIKRSICFYNKPADMNRLAAKMDVTMFICLDRYKNDCISEIPFLGPNFQKEFHQIPRYLSDEPLQTYQLRCYIFQGKISFGFDKSGLSDGFVRIITQNQLKETKVIPHSLNPIWDQTIIFYDIVIRNFDTQTILMEVLDRDELGNNEFIGRTIVNPPLRLNKNEQDSRKMEWFKIYRNEEVSAQILAAFEYKDSNEDSENLDLPKKGKMLSIPVHIKPVLVSHKIEVLFWGIRRLGKINYLPIRQPRITVFCGDFNLNSTTIEHVKTNPNFSQQTHSMIMTFPLEKDYAPPLSIKMYDSKRFGVYSFAGVYISKMSPFFVTPITIEERSHKLTVSLSYVSNGSDSRSSSSIEMNKLGLGLKDKDKISEEVLTKPKRRSWFLSKCCQSLWTRKKSISSHSIVSYEPLKQQEDEEYVEDYDWWTKFYASMNGSDVDSISKGVRTLKIYQSELESQPEFKGFKDVLTPFPIFKGKTTGDYTIDEENITGIFKGSVKIYQYPLKDNQDYVFTNGVSLEKGYFSSYPENYHLRYLVRIYCIRALNLRPKDVNGKSDPYICVKLNDKEITDKNNYVARNVNPVFGRCFEFYGIFPLDYLLKISIWDYDLTTADDLIGETEIDLENRFYTKHMAFCGIAETYETSGYCTWRGQHKPTCILTEICQKFNLPTPEYKDTSVKIGEIEFISQNFLSGGDEEVDKEVLALTALRRWKEMPLVGFSLVPEHVETRSLFHPSKPGIEQGKLQLWVDIFQILDTPPPKKVDVSLRKPTTYELRVIIWNTEEVVLDEDDFFSGERKSDIYVKGWLVDSLQPQYTDVHYRSLTGEGNFNWRFIFRFDYLSTENKIVVKKKESIFAIDETEFKIPCKLILQVWDNDTFSKDDFLGTLTLELAKLYRPAKTVKKCTLDILKKGAPTVNLFKIRRTRGWWPFKAYGDKIKDETCTGKIEAELELLILEDALKDPAGLGRHEPQPLPMPNRPDTSFSWFKNPLKALKYIVCKLHKWKIIRTLCFLLLCFLIFLAIYAFPGYTVKKLLGA